MNVEFSNPPGLEPELNAEAANAAAPVAPFEPVELRRSRLVTARNSLDNATVRVRHSAVPRAQRIFSLLEEKVAPVIDRAQARRAQLAAALAAVIAVLVVLRRRQAVDPVIDDSIA
jgi:hypothetical protein